MSYPNISVLVYYVVGRKTQKGKEVKGRSFKGIKIFEKTFHSYSKSGLGYRIFHFFFFKWSCHFEAWREGVTTNGPIIKGKRNLKEIKLSLFEVTTSIKLKGVVLKGDTANFIYIAFFVGQI